MQAAILTLHLLFGLVCALAILPTVSIAAPYDLEDSNLQSSPPDEDSADFESWKSLFQSKLRQELAMLDEAESRIVRKIEALNSERQNIIARKRGHRPCLVNFIACFRKRK